MAMVLTVRLAFPFYATIYAKFPMPLNDPVLHSAVHGNEPNRNHLAIQQS